MKYYSAYQNSFYFGFSDKVKWVYELDSSSYYTQYQCQLNTVSVLAYPCYNPGFAWLIKAHVSEQKLLRQMTASLRA